MGTMVDEDEADEASPRCASAASGLACLAKASGTGAFLLPIPTPPPVADGPAAADEVGTAEADWDGLDSPLGEGAGRLNFGGVVKAGASGLRFGKADGLWSGEKVGGEVADEAARDLVAAETAWAVAVEGVARRRDSAQARMPSTVLGMPRPLEGRSCEAEKSDARLDARLRDGAPSEMLMSQDPLQLRSRLTCLRKDSGLPLLRRMPFLGPACDAMTGAGTGRGGGEGDPWREIMARRMRSEASASASAPWWPCISSPT